MIQAILLDYDGTIHDMDATLSKNLDGILGLNGKDLYRIYLYDVHRALIHKKFLDRHDDIIFHCQLLFQILQRPYDPEAAELICSRLEKAGRDFSNMKFFEDAVPALRRIKESGVEIYLSTGKNAEEKAKAFERYAMEGFFKGVFSESKSMFLKTDVRYYIEALKGIGRSPRETLSIGDTLLSDIKPAKEAGIKTIWVNRRGEPAPQDPGSMPDYTASNLLEASEMLFKI